MWYWEFRKTVFVLKEGPDVQKKMQGHYESVHYKFNFYEVYFLKRSQRSRKISRQFEFALLKESHHVEVRVGWPGNFEKSLQNARLSSKSAVKLLIIPLCVPMYWSPKLVVIYVIDVKTRTISSSLAPTAVTTACYHLQYDPFLINTWDELWHIVPKWHSNVSVLCVFTG